MTMETNPMKGRDRSFILYLMQFKEIKMSRLKIKNMYIITAPARHIQKFRAYLTFRTLMLHL